MTTLVQNLLIPLVTIIGLIVLIALHDVSSAVAVPIIAGIAGVHVGANISSPGVSTTPTKTPPV